MPVPAQLLALTWLHTAQSCQYATGAQAGQPQTLTVEALSPHVQDDGVPPLPMGLISIPASWGIHCLHWLQNTESQNG